MECDRGLTGPARRITVLALLALAAGCGRGPGDASEYTVADSAGVRIVESTAPAWSEGSHRIEAEPTLRIGREEAGPYQLGFVGGAVFLADGRVAVAEASAQEVRVYDAAGRHLRTLGGTGEGPGELSGLGALFAYAGDSVAVFDGRLFRTTIFSISSGAHRMIQNPVEGNYGPFGIVAGGPFLLRHGGTGYRPDLTPGLQWVFTDIVAMDPSDGDSRVIAHLPNQERLVTAEGNAPMREPLRYAVMAAADGGFYWGTSDRWQVGFYDASGALRRLVRRPIEPRAVEPGMIERYIEDQLDRVRRFEGELAVPRYRALYEDEEFGEHLPVFTSAFVDDAGRLWISASEWPSQGPPRLWSLFAPEGHWLGDLDAPAGVHVVDARGDLVLGIARDSLDVPSVQVHRLVGG